MSRGRDISNIIDEVLVEANAVTQRQTKEAAVIKEAATQPRTEVARGLRALAADLRGTSSAITYDDLRVA